MTAAVAVLQVDAALGLSRKNLGQYFTPERIASFMLSLSKVGSDAKVLEPSSGEGVFIELLQQKGVSDIVGYEIDPELAKLHPCVRCESFVGADIKERFDLVIGNPPYIRWKNLDSAFKEELAENELWNRYFNSLCDYSYIFMLKGVELLKEGGELIFICPEYWMNTTNSQTLRNYFSDHGYFTDFYIFNEAPIFKGATVSTVVFRFVKSSVAEKPKMHVAKFSRKADITAEVIERLIDRKEVPGVCQMELEQFRRGQRWVFAPVEEQNALERLMLACEIEDRENGLLQTRRMATIGDVCDIGNGMVSGLDKAFQIPDDVELLEEEKKASIFVYKAKELRQYLPMNATRYIYVPEDIVREEIFDRSYPNFRCLMHSHKDALSRRYDYGRNLPYWQWCFKRNEKLFKRRDRRIFVPCKERISSKSYVRFAIVEANYYPTQDVTALFKKAGVRESIEYILAYLNYPLVFEWIRHYGIVKGNIVEFSEKPLSSIPFRRINWDDANEVEMHDRITCLTDQLIRQKDLSVSKNINDCIGGLIK